MTGTKAGSAKQAWAREAKTLPKRAIDPITGKYNTASGKPPWREPHTPNADTRLIVRLLTIGGYSQSKICKSVGCNDKTLRKHYRHELDYAQAEADAIVIQSQFYQAVGGPKHDWKQAVPTMTKLYLESRVDWKAPRQDVGLSGAVGVYDASKLAKLSDAELKAFEAILTRIAPGDSTPVGDQGGAGET